MVLQFVGEYVVAFASPVRLTPRVFENPVSNETGFFVFGTTCSPFGLGSSPLLRPFGLRLGSLEPQSKNRLGFFFYTWSPLGFLLLISNARSANASGLWNPSFLSRGSFFILTSSVNSIATTIAIETCFAWGIAVEIPRFWAWIATHSPTEWNEKTLVTRKVVHEGTPKGRITWILIIKLMHKLWL